MGKSIARRLAENLLSLNLRELPDGEFGCNLLAKKTIPATITANFPSTQVTYEGKDNKRTEHMALGIKKGTDHVAPVIDMDPQRAAAGNAAVEVTGKVVS